MNVNAVMDRANKAVERKLGVLVAYVRKGSQSPIADPDGLLKADFQENFAVARVGLITDAATVMPALDFRRSLLEDFELRPGVGDSVTFTAIDGSRTYKVQSVHHTAPGSIVLLLGERT